MTPTEAISTLNDAPEGLRKQLDRKVSELGDEMQHVAQQWTALGSMGAQREDHAAELLGKLRAHLNELSTFCGHCSTQITAMIADPYGRKSQVTP
jgi:hypothetical protein